MGAELSFVKDLTPHTALADEKKGDSKPIQGFILDLLLQETGNCTNWQMWQHILYNEVKKMSSSKIKIKYR